MFIYLKRTLSNKVLLNWPSINSVNQFLVHRDETKFLQSLLDLKFNQFDIRVYSNVTLVMKMLVKMVIVSECIFKI